MIANTSPLKVITTVECLVEQYLDKLLMDTNDGTTETKRRPARRPSRDNPVPEGKRASGKGGHQTAGLDGRQQHGRPHILHLDGQMGRLRWGDGRLEVADRVC